MARKSNEERYGEWASRISSAERELDYRIHDWDENLRRYRMDFSDVEDPNQDSVRINHQFAISRIILPSVYFQNPDVIVIPRGKTPLPIARVREEILNYQFEQQDLEGEARKAIFDSLFCGIGWIKQGFGEVEEFGKKANPVDEFADSFSDSLLDEDLWEGTEPKEDLIIDQRIKAGAPFAIRVSPKFILLDPLATDLKTARWICHKILKPVKEVKQDKRYSRRLTSGIEGHLNLSDQRALNSVPNWNRTLHFTHHGVNLGQEELVMVYEIWDRETNKIYVMDSFNREHGQKKFIREEDNPYDLDGYPFEALVFNHDPESPFGIPDAEVWRNPTDAMNLLSTMHYNHVKRFNRKYIAAPGAFKEEEMDKLTSPIDGAIAVANVPVGEAIIPLQDATVTPDLYNLAAQLQEKLNSVSGTNEQRRGNVQKGATATEASIIEQHSRVLDNDRLSLVSKWINRIARKQDKLNKQFLTNDFVSFLTDPASAQLWEQIPEDILKAEVDVKIRVGSSGFISRDLRTKQLMEFFNIVGGQRYPDGSPVANIPEFIRRIGEALQQDDLDALINPPPMMPPPMPPQPGGEGGPIQEGGVGGENLGDMLSGMQNLGMSRTAPNPTAEREQAQ